MWRPSIATRRNADSLLALQVIPETFQKEFSQNITAFIDKHESLFKADDFLLLHGDCHFGNLISRQEEGFYLVDFDDCVVGPAIQDVWMLLPDIPEHCQTELSWFAEGYETFRDFPDSSLKLIPVLSLMRQIHFAAWCAIQKDEPHFQTHFPTWGSPQYWEVLIRDLQI